MPSLRRGRLGSAMVMMVLLASATACASAVTPVPSVTPRPSVGPSPTASPGPTIVQSASPGADGFVGYLGCSMTRDSVSGYHLQGGRRLWPRLEIGGGTITVWNDSKVADVHGYYWGIFDAARAAQPPAEIWWQICRSDDEAAVPEDELYAAAIGVVHQVTDRLPGMPIHVSAQPDYTAGHLCKGTGTDGPATSRAIADRLVADRLAVRAPDPPTLAADDLSDQCHPAEAGQRLLGDQLIAYFDRELGSRAKRSASGIFLVRRRSDRLIPRRRVQS